MTEVTVLESIKVRNLAELRWALQHMAQNELHQIDDRDVNINGAPIEVRCERQKLTDGSEVYNVSIWQEGL